MGNAYAFKAFGQPLFLKSLNDAIILLLKYKPLPF
jgi:hypothetical protein